MLWYPAMGEDDLIFEGGQRRIQLITLEESPFNQINFFFSSSDRSDQTSLTNLLPFQHKMLEKLFFDQKERTIPLSNYHKSIAIESLIVVPKFIFSIPRFSFILTLIIGRASIRPSSKDRALSKGKCPHHS